MVSSGETDRCSLDSRMYTMGCGGFCEEDRGMLGLVLEISTVRGVCRGAETAQGVFILESW